MRRLLITLAGGLAALVISAAIAGFLLLRGVDLKSRVAAAIQSATGRTVAIRGPVGFSLYPTLGVHAQEVSLGNAPGGRAANMVEARQLDVGVAMPALMNHVLQVTQLDLVDPVINLEILPSGAPNWVFTMKAAPPGAPRINAVNELRLSGVSIANGRIEFYNAATHSAFAVDKVDASVDLAGLDKALSLKGAATYAGERAQVGVSLTTPRLLIEGKPMGLALNLSSAPLTVRFEGVLEPGTSGLKGALSASGPDLRRLAAWGGNPIGAGAGLKNFAVNGQFVYANHATAFNNATVSIDAVSGRGDLLIETAHPKPYISGRLELASLDLNPYLARVSAAAPSSGAPAPRLAPSSVAASSAAPTSGAPSSRAPSSGAPSSGAPSSGAPSSGAPSSGAPSSGAPPASIAPSSRAPPSASGLQPIDVRKAGYDTTPLDYAGLRSFNANLDLTTGVLQVHKMRIDRAKVSVVMSEGFLAASLTEMELYGGKGVGKVRIDARGSPLRFEESLDADGVRALPLFTDALGLTTLDATANVTLNLAAEGASQQDLISTLSGDGAFYFGAGAFRGVDFGGVTRTVSNVIAGRVTGPNAQTPFTQFSATFHLARGVAATRDFKLDGPRLLVTAQGQIDLGSQSLDLRFTPRTVFTRNKQTGKAGITGLPLPVRAVGPWTKLKFTTDIGGAGKRTEEREICVVTHDC